MTEFGIYLPNVGWETLPKPFELADYASAAEQLGFDSVWVEDRLIHPRVGILDALTTLTFVASRTERIKLGTSILLINLRNPLVLAKAISTLDYLSNGRLVLGVSLGGRPGEYQAAGVPMKTRVTRFLETLKVMRAFWGQGSVGDAYRFFQPTEVDMGPRPVQRPLPIWIGGRSEAVYQRVATLGDGWLASSTSADEFALGWAKITDQVVASGRDLNSITPAKFCYVHVDDSTEKALTILDERLPKYYDFPYDVARLALYGPPARVVQQAGNLFEAGVRTLILATVTHDIAQLERLAQEVLPHLKRQAST